MALNFCGNLISWITDPFFPLSMNKFSRIIKYWEQVPGFNDIIVFSLAEKTSSFLFHKGDIETRFNILLLKNHTL